MKKIYKWIYALIFAVSLYSCIRWVTDYTKEGHYWTQSLGNSILEIVILAFVSYLFFIYFRRQIEKSRRAKEPNRWKFVWRSYGMPFLLIILGVNATLAITRIFTGDTFHMDDIIIANVIGSLFAFMVYNVQRAQVLDKDYAEQRIQLEKIKNDQLQTELKFLKSQYHPHFLFNALNTVYFQIDESNKAPRRTLEMISELLRYQLYGGNQKVSILQEIDYLKTYIALRKLRMSERLRLRVEFPPELNELNIYPLLFLPLVENAFKYVGGDYQLDIIMKWENNRISLFIRNSIPELSAEDEALRKSVDERQRKGIGLVNLRRRLSLLYPNKHRLETRKEETEFVAELMIEMTITCVITDDEPMARKGLQSYVERVDFLSLTGVCEDAIQLNTLLKTQQPDLLLLDIEMPYLSGLDLLATLNQPPKVIVTSAYEQYALKGYELDVVDYLLKPISFERFLKGVNKVHDLLARENTPDADASFFVKSEKQMRKIYLRDILFVEALENYVSIYTTSGRVLTHSTLKRIGESLPDDQFLQTHKSYIINADRVDLVEGNRLRIESYQIPIARNLRDIVFKRILKNTL